MPPTLKLQDVEEIVNPSLQFLDSVGEISSFAMGSNDPEAIKAKAELLSEQSCIIERLNTTNLQRCQSIAMHRSNQPGNLFDFQALSDELDRFAIWVRNMGLWRERLQESARTNKNIRIDHPLPSLNFIQAVDGLRRMAMAEEARLRAFVRAEEAHSQDIEQPEECPKCDLPRPQIHLPQVQVFVGLKENNEQPELEGTSSKPKNRITDKSLEDVILALLQQHHNYASDSFNFEPVIQKELAEKLSETQQGEKKDRTSTVSRFFKVKFKGHKEYQRECCSGDIQSRLAFLSGDVDRKQLVKELDEARVVNVDDGN